MPGLRFCFAGIAVAAVATSTGTNPVPAVGATAMFASAALQPEPTEAEVQPTTAPAATYHTYRQLSDWIRRIASEYSSICTVTSIGKSLQNRDLLAIRLALPGEINPDLRPAILIVANLDGNRLVGSEVSVLVVKRLAAAVEADDEAATAFLTDNTLYVVPRANPDAAEWFFGDVRSGRSLNMRPDDRDRDGMVDEDPPNDLNGDGMITMMRVFDPQKADMMPDAEEPRLDVKPDRDKGERAEYTLYVEGIDDDQDGEFNEDGIGGIDPNRNFMHGFKEHSAGAGVTPVSEPESLALIKYVLDHQNIAVVLTYGRQDTLTKTPDGKGKDDAGAPKNIEPGDVGLYKEIGERFKEITGLKSVASSASDGAFHAWAYAQFGVPSFSTPLWTRPEPEKTNNDEDKNGEDQDVGNSNDATDGADDGDGEDDASALTPSGIGDIAADTIEELREAASAAGFEVTDEMMSGITPAQIEQFASQMGIEVQHVESKKDDSGGDSGKAKNKEDAAWLKYSDDVRNGEGFVQWQKFDHPDLGEVEIGGWAPYFKTNPPPEALRGIAEKQVEFILNLAGRLPDVSIEPPEITRLAKGLYEIKVAVVNNGYLPTGTAMAVHNRRARPYVLRLSTPVDQIVTGRRIHKHWSIPGSGGRKDHRWIIQADDGSSITITLYSEKFGQKQITMTLSDH